MKSVISFVAAFVLLVGFANSSHAGDCGDRPCGPDSLPGPLRLLVPQGFAGADFRDACRRHDHCYEVPGANKAACDRRYLRDMQCECKNSRMPIACKAFARLMYSSVRWGGGDAFRTSQRIALGR